MVSKKEADDLSVRVLGSCLSGPQKDQIAEIVYDRLALWVEEGLLEEQDFPVRLLMVVGEDEDPPP